MRPVGLGIVPRVSGRGLALGVAAFALIAGVAAALMPLPHVIVLLAVVAGVLVLALRPSWSILLTVVFATITLPAALPTVFEIGGITIRLYEPLLYLSGLYVLTRHRPSRYATMVVVFLALVPLAGTIYGFLAGNESAKVLLDARWPTTMAVGAYVVAGIASTPIAVRCLRVLRWTLWISAAVILAGSFGLSVGGRAEAATLGATSAADATRLLTPSGFPALVVLCGSFALVIARRQTVREVAGFVLPALVVLFLGFSRNHLLGLLAAIVFAVVAARSAESTVGLVRRICVAVIPTAAMVALVALAIQPGSWLDRQLESYDSRVLTGLTAESLNSDPSTQYRLRENEYLYAAIDESPVIGHGLGYAYQPSGGKSGDFNHDVGPYYAHNFYLWAVAKVGAVGLLAWLAALLAPVLAALRRPSGIQLAAGSGAAACLAVSVVAPMPIGTPTAFLLGAVIGLLASARRYTRGVDGAAVSRASEDPAAWFDTVTPLPKMSMREPEIRAGHRREDERNGMAAPAAASRV